MSSPVFDHLATMTGEHGLFEHACGAVPRIEHGYCTDDNARMLVVTSRETDAGLPGRLSRVALAFTLAAQAPDGGTRNRMNGAGRWTDAASMEDCWGRSVWALGVAATHHDDPAVRLAARAGFEVGVTQRSPWPRAMAFAALGAADVAAADPAHGPAGDLMRDAAHLIGPPACGAWAWPEPRLAYANATLADAVVAAGAALGDAVLLDRGLGMLEWLLDRETRAGHLSVSGAGGCGPSATGPQFDQQPIEVAALAEACWRAYTLTGRQHWADGVVVAAAWFDGANDSGAVMHDAASNGCFDGLMPSGVNLNQGAESTLAYIATRQRARTLTADVS